MNHNRRIYAGFYKRYDGEIIYVISTAKDGDTGESTVIYTPYSLMHDNKFFTVSKDSFCSSVIVDGNEVLKYQRQTQMKASTKLIEDLKEKGLRGPIRRSSADHYMPSSDEFRFYQDSPSYYEYAKDLCKHYAEDLNLVRLCAKEKKYIGISKKDFDKVYEDVIFLRDSLKTLLKEYKVFFDEHYIQNTSIRRYAESHSMNRGSVEYIQRKLLRDLSDLLYKRDYADGKNRLHQKTKRKNHVE